MKKDCTYEHVEEEDVEQWSRLESWLLSGMLKMLYKSYRDLVPLITKESAVDFELNFIGWEGYFPKVA